MNKYRDRRANLHAGRKILRFLVLATVKSNGSPYATGPLSCSSCL